MGMRSCVIGMRLFAAASCSAVLDGTVAVNDASPSSYRFRLRTTNSSGAVAVIVWREWSRSLTVK
jgi:hypothetical protein